MAIVIDSPVYLQKVKSCLFLFGRETRELEYRRVMSRAIGRRTTVQRSSNSYARPGCGYATPYHGAFSVYRPSMTIPDSIGNPFTGDQLEGWYRGRPAE